MKRRRTVLLGLLGVAVVFVAAFALLYAIAHHRPHTREWKTTWEGDWEVPVIEGDYREETFVLGKNKRLLIKVQDNVYDFYAGDEVNVRWEPGKVFVNGITVFPVPIERKILSVREVMDMYGNIPTVRDYIAAHREEASEDTVATEAVEAWFARQDEVLKQAWERYAAAIRTAPPHQAAQEAAEAIRASGLADSVVVDEKAAPAESQEQWLIVHWQGTKRSLVPVSPWRSELPPPTVTAKRLYAHLTGEVNRLTYGENKLTVRYENGNLFLEGDLSPRPEGGKP